MAQLRHQNSMVAFEKHHGGCTWSWLQIFDFHLHHHQRSRHLLEYNNHGSNKRTEDPKIYVSLPTKEDENWDSEANLLIVNKSKLKKRSSSKALLKSLSKMMFKKQYQKHKPLTVKESLQDAVSIHHLECNDYVLPEETVHDSDMLNLDENLPLLQKGEGCEICRALDVITHIKKTQIDKLKVHSTAKEAKLNQKLRKTWENLKKKESIVKNFGDDVTFQSKDFVTMLELYNVHRDLFVKILNDPKFSLEKLSKDLHSSSSWRHVKSGSYPMAMSSRNAQPSKHNHGWIANFHSINMEVKHNAEERPTTLEAMNKGLHAMPSESEAKADTQQTERNHVSSSSTETLNNYYGKHKDQKDDEMDLNHIRDLFEDIINDTKEQFRISKDAVMHKVPYGQKISEDMVTSKLFRSTSDRGYNDNLRYKPSVQSTRNQDRSMRRTRSLSDSLDRYSNLLASIATKENKILTGTSSLTKEESSSQDNMKPNPLESNFSNFGILKPLNKEIQHEIFDRSVPSVASPSSSLDGKQTLESEGSAYQHSVPTFGIREKSVSGITGRHTPDEIAGSIFEEHKEQSLLTTKDEQNGKSHIQVLAEKYEASVTLCHQASLDLENQLSDDKIQQKESTDILDSEKTGYKQTTLDEHNDEFVFETDDEPTKPSPTSVLDSALEEEFTPRSLQPEVEILSMRQPKLDFGLLDRLEDTESTITEEEAGSSKYIGTFNSKEDNDEEFNYVKNVLKKFSFSGMDLVGAGSSMYQLEHLLLGELDGLPDQCSRTTFDYDDADVNHKLLADLANEALSEICKSSVACIWLSRYSSHVRPFPVGNHLLEEVWSKISKLVISQTQTSPTIDSILEIDFAKKDVWPNFHLSAESLGTEVAENILDHMLEELILEFDDD